MMDRPPSASSTTLGALLARRLRPRNSTPAPSLPLPDEPGLALWQEWAEEARSAGVFATLVRHLPQLAFPIREGIGQEPSYRAATLRGTPTTEIPEATGLDLARPESLELEIYPSPAGRVPMLIARHRGDFERLLQALARRNEPSPVPAAQGALAVAGYNNWARLHRLRREWQQAPPPKAATWEEELARLKATPELYQDRFILLSDGPYSAVSAAELGLTEPEWRERSLALRRAHEACHLFTRRLYGSMANHPLDELIADYCGLVAAFGRFEARWFLRFLGLESLPALRPDGRFTLYCGSPPLEESERRELAEVVARAAHQVEAFDRATSPERPRTAAELGRTIETLATYTLPELAEEGAPALLSALLLAG